MTNGPGVALPAHVKQYLEKYDVDPDDLKPQTLVALSGLTAGEVAVLDYVGYALKDEDQATILRIH